MGLCMRVAPFGAMPRGPGEASGVHQPQALAEREGVFHNRKGSLGHQVGNGEVLKVYLLGGEFVAQIDHAPLQSWPAISDIWLGVRTVPVLSVAKEVAEPATALAAERLSMTGRAVRTD